MKRIYYYLLPLLLLCSCENALRVDLPEHESKLTLNAILTEGRPIDLYLTRSFGLTEEKETWELAVEDARVELWINGELKDVMKFEKGVGVDTLFSYWYPLPDGRDSVVYAEQEIAYAKYIPSTEIALPVAGDLIEFRASHPLYGEASGNTRIPAFPEVLSVDYVKDSVSTRDFDDGYRDRWSSLKIRLANATEGETAYNLVNRITYAYPLNQPDVLDTTAFWQWAFTEITRSADGIVYGNNSPIADTSVLADGGTLHAWFQFPGCCGYAETILDEPNYDYQKMDIRLLVLTKEYADFQDKLNLQKTNRSQGLESVFIPSEPVVIPSNVEGGYGMVGSYQVVPLEILF